MTTPMELVKSLETASSALTTSNYYFGIAPSTATIPFVVGELINTTDNLASSQVAYQDVRILFTIVSVNATNIDTILGHLETMCDNANGGTTTMLRNKALSTRVERTQLRSRSNQMVYVCTREVSFWVSPN